MGVGLGGGSLLFGVGLSDVFFVRDWWGRLGAARDCGAALSSACSAFLTLWDKASTALCDDFSEGWVV